MAFLYFDGFFCYFSFIGFVCYFNFIGFVCCFSFIGFVCYFGFSQLWGWAAIQGSLFWSFTRWTIPDLSPCPPWLPKSLKSTLHPTVLNICTAGALLFISNLVLVTLSGKWRIGHGSTQIPHNSFHCYCQFTILEVPHSFYCLASRELQDSPDPEIRGKCQLFQENPFFAVLSLYGRQTHRPHIWEMFSFSNWVENEIPKPMLALNFHWMLERICFGHFIGWAIPDLSPVSWEVGQKDAAERKLCSSSIRPPLLSYPSTLWKGSNSKIAFFF